MGRVNREVNTRHRLLGLLAIIAGAAPAAANEAVSITLTEHGIPHIVAPSFHGAGFGHGYASARIDLCEMADTLATSSGYRSEVYGSDKSVLRYLPRRAEVPNTVSDLLARFLVDEALLQRMYQSMSDDARALVRGYADGYNRYLASVPAAKRPKACRNLPLRSLTVDDVLRRLAAVALTSVFSNHDSLIYEAAPPGADAGAVGADGSAAATVFTTLDEATRSGSNAIAIGKDMTVNGRGLLLGNPHYFWRGPNHFFEVHLTVPGRYDVMGVALYAVPVIAMGFNQSLAWSHTTSSDIRGTAFKLKLDPEDPTRYFYDGRSVAMKKQRVTIATRDAEGRVGEASHDFWMTRFGPVMEGSQFPWDRKAAYALRDANLENFRVVDQWLEMGRSRNVAELKQALDRVVGLPWVNTVAADADGAVLYADISVAPGLDKELYEACTIRSESPYGMQFNVMDGSTSACEWRTYPGTPQPGILPAAMRPWTIRNDYVVNSNDSYWLPNVAQRLEGYSPAIGRERVQLIQRGRLAHVQIADRINGRDGLPGNRFDVASLGAVLLSSRNFAAELVVDDLVAACTRTPRVTLPDGSTEDLTQPCKILARWDRRDDLDSVGVPIFREFVNQYFLWGPDARNFWREPFDPARPIETPRGLRTDTPETLQKLALAVRKVRAAGIALDAPLRDVQFAIRKGVRIPLMGGPSDQVFNTLEATLVPGQGYTDPVGNSPSYVQVVGFDDRGPVADALLVDSQSSDPDSPFRATQMPLYSAKKWVRLPFTPVAVAAAAIEPPLAIETDPGAAGAVSYDVLIRGGSVYDGSGAEPFTGDVAIREDRIVYVGPRAPGAAKRTVDAKGRAVAPGFINMLSWAQRAMRTDASAQSDLRQGVTLELFGEGVSHAPLNDVVRKEIQEDADHPMPWSTFDEFLRAYERLQPAPNVGSFVGATTARMIVLGMQDVQPTFAQTEAMRALVRKAMEEGAMGLGASITYWPATYARTAELAAMAQEAGRCGGIYAAHIRNEGDRVLEAVDETIEIARLSGAPAEIHHLKLAGRANWDKLPPLTAKVEAARRSGTRITANMYLYTAGMSDLVNGAMPRWVQDGGRDAWLARLKDPQTRARLLEEMRHPVGWESFYAQAGADGTRVIGLSSPALRQINGKSLAEIARLRGTTPEDAAIDILLEERSSPWTLYFEMSESNIREQLRLPWMSIGSDAPAQSAAGESLKSGMHPRAYGNVARLLGKYVREEKVLPLEVAIHKLTGQPAANLALRDRGLLQAGYFADVVVFDPQKIVDRATYEDPHRYAIGVEQVWVNGVQALRDGEPTGAPSGRIIRGRAWTGWPDGGCRMLASDWHWAP